jgi:hypothetical protein
LYLLTTFDSSLSFLAEGRPDVVIERSDEAGACIFLDNLGTFLVVAIKYRGMIIEIACGVVRFVYQLKPVRLAGGALDTSVRDRNLA